MTTRKYSVAQHPTEALLTWVKSDEPFDYDTFLENRQGLATHKTTSQVEGLS